MLLARLIFNTYGFFLESIAKANSIQTLITFKNSLMWPYYLSVINFFSTNAPLKIDLFIELTLRLLAKSLVRFFLLRSQKLISYLSIKANSGFTIQGDCL